MQTSLLIYYPLSRVPPSGSIAWGFDKLTHHGNPLRGPFQSGLGLALLQQIHKPFLKIFIAQFFFFLCKMNFPALLRIIAVDKRCGLFPKLLGGKVKDATANIVVAVKVSVPKGNAVNFSAKNVLGKKSRNGTLPLGPVFL